MLEGRNLTCIRDGRALFKDLNVHLQSSEILQIEGANGAGKTSLLRILCGLAQPQQGTVYWQGDDIRRCRPLYYQTLLYLGHNPGIKQELTAFENLRFFRSLSGHKGSTTDLEEALDQIGLYGYEDILVRALSAGQKRRVALARLWLSTASVWVLDEPFTAIDRVGIRNLEFRLAQHVRKGGMVLFTSHQASHLNECRVRRLSLG